MQSHDAAPDPYAHIADRFLGHYSSLRGAVRFALLRQQLDKHAPAPSARVVDIGGGGGHMAIHLARRGHEVTLVDPSARMLAEARTSLGDQPSEVSSRVQLVRAHAVDASERLGHARFDLVVCHAVLPYVDDPGSLITSLAKLAAPGAVLSLVFKNADALAMRAGLERRWADALAAFDQQADTGGLAVETRAHRLADITATLESSDFSIIDWYGVRVLTDHLEDAPPDNLDQVVEVEAEAGRRDPYRALGRLLHVVARRQRT